MFWLFVDSIQSIGENEVASWQPNVYFSHVARKTIFLSFIALLNVMNTVNQ